MLYLEDLKIQRGNKIVFSDFNAVIKTGSTTVIRGKNGSGKSTLLMTMMIPAVLLEVYIFPYYAPLQ